MKRLMSMITQGFQSKVNDQTRAHLHRDERQPFLTHDVKTRPCGLYILCEYFVPLSSVKSTSLEIEFVPKDPSYSFLAWRY